MEGIFKKTFYKLKNFFPSLLYQWAGKELPFILLALLALFDGSLFFN